MRQTPPPHEGGHVWLVTGRDVSVCCVRAVSPTRHSPLSYVLSIEVTVAGVVTEYCHFASTTRILAGVRGWFRHLIA